MQGYKDHAMGIPAYELALLALIHSFAVTVLHPALMHGLDVQLSSILLWCIELDQ